MSLFTNFLEWMGFKRKKVNIQLDPDLIKENTTINALANENAELKGQIGKLSSVVAQFRESDKDAHEEEEVKKELQRQKLEIQKESKGKYLSLRKLFTKYNRDKKFREKLKITSFDRGTEFSKFGDFGISEDGKFVIVDDKGNDVIRMERLNDLFQSVPGLGNDIRSFKIPINLDKDYGYVENVMVWESPEVIREEDGNYRYTKAKKRPFYELLKEKEEIIGKLQQELEETETVIIELQEERDDLKRGSRLNETSANTSRSELSKAETRQSSVERHFRETEKDLMKLRQMNVVSEDNLDRLERELVTLRKKAERENVKVNFEDAFEKIRLIRNDLVRNEPEKEIKIVREVTEAAKSNPQ